STASSAPEPLTVDVYPRVMQAGEWASVRLRMEPDALSRRLQITWLSDEGAGGLHRRDVQGERAPVRTEFPLKHLEPGEYEIVVEVARADGSTVRRRTSIVVLPR